MSKIEKKLSLLLSLILLFECIMSAFSFTIAKNYVTIQAPTNGKQTYTFDGKTPGFNTNQYNVVQVQVTTSGIYTIQVRNMGTDASYEICDSTGKILPLATPPGGSLANAVNGTAVSVYLEAGSTYYLPIYSNAKENENYKITLNQTYKASGIEDVDIWDVSTSEYTLIGKGADNVDGFNIHRNLLSDYGGQATVKDHVEAGQALPYNINTSEDGNVNLIQRLITYFFIFGIADPFYALITALFGSISIDKLVFNKYNSTKLAFYPENGRGTTDANKFLETPTTDSGILSLVSSYYDSFRKIAVVFYIILLLYIGVRMLLKSTAVDKDKYKSMLMDWFVGILMLVFFPYAIKYMIIINEKMVDYLDKEFVQAYDISDGLGKTSNNVMPELLSAMGEKSVGDDGDIMTSYRKKAIDTGNIGFAFVYVYLLVKLFGFIIFYFKRLISVIFLIVLFPFVCISYALDKIKDGSAQAFNNWFKEFLLNILNQFFQASIYIVVMFTINALISSGTSNVLLTCIGIGFVSRSETLLRAIFPSLLGGGGANTVTPLEQTAKTAIAMNMIKDLEQRGKKLAKTAKNVKTSFNDSKNAFKERRAANLEAQVEESEQRVLQHTLLSPEAAQRNVDAATQDIGSTLTPPGAPGPARTPSLGDIDLRMKNYSRLVAGLENEDTHDAYENAINAKMATLPPDQRAKFQAELKAVKAIQEVTTGKDSQGKTLSREQYALSANIAIEALNADPATNPAMRDVQKWAKDKNIKYKKKVPVDPSIKTAQDAKEWERKHDGRSAYKYVDTETSLDSHVKAIAKGNTLSAEQSRLLQGASKFVGGRDGIYTGTQTSATVGADGRVTFNNRPQEGDSVGASSVYSMTHAEEVAATSRRDSTGRSIKQKMLQGVSSQDMGDAERAADLLLILGEYNDRLNSGDPTRQIDGVSSDEVFTITSELKELADSNAAAARLIQDTISTDSATPGAAVEDTADGMKINLGTTLTGLQTIAAKTVVTDRRLAGKKRTKVIDDAVKTLSKVSHQIGMEQEGVDDTAQAIWNRSDLDAYIGDNALLEDNIDDELGLIRDDATTEELFERQYKDELQARADRIAKDKLVEATQRSRSANGKLVRAVAELTLGTAAKAAGIATTESFAAGAGVKLDVGNAAFIANTTEGAVDTITHPLTHLGNVFDVHPMQEAREEKNLKRKIEAANRQSSITPEQKEARARGDAAVRNIGTFRNRLS